MRAPPFVFVLGILSVVCSMLGSPAMAQASGASTAPEGLTGKERLAEKWTDEQRIDNCKVPIDKRGPTPRPDRCSGIATTSLVMPAKAGIH